MGLEPVVVILATCLAAEPGASETLAEIVRDVRAAEALYRDIDVTYEKTYSVGEHVRKSYEGVKATPPQAVGSSGETLFSQRKVHLVTVADKYRLETAEQTEDPLGMKDPTKLVRAFDGKTTRELVNDRTHAEFPGRVGDGVFRPHVLLFHFGDRVAMSNLLESGERYGTTERTDQRHSLEYNGFESVDGVPCVRVTVANLAPTVPVWTNRWQLWLATERSFLPARCLGWTRHQSETTPVSEYRIVRWMDLGDGVWLPAESKVERLDGQLLKTGEKKVRWRETVTIVKATLKPKVEDRVFETAGGTVVEEWF